MVFEDDEPTKEIPMLPPLPEVPSTPGPHHEESHLLDNPDYVAQQCDELLEHYKQEVSRLKAENDALRVYRDRYASLSTLVLKIREAKDLLYLIESNIDLARYKADNIPYKLPHE